MVISTVPHRVISEIFVSPCSDDSGYHLIYRWMNKAMHKKILIVEDDENIAELVRLHLADLKHTLKVCRDGDAAWQACQQTAWDLVILDIMLPGLDGLELCRRIRAMEGTYPSILMLTSKTTELDRVLGLELGADDYLTKPFSLMELVARVKALLRRSEAMAQTAETQTLLEFGMLTIEPETHEVRYGENQIDLTAKEFDLLLFFARHPGQVFSRRQLLDQVWGYTHEGYEHTVNSHMNRLRKKIEQDPASPALIKTIWGVGYQFFGGEG